MKTPKNKWTFLYGIHLLRLGLKTAFSKKPKYQDPHLLFEDTFEGKELDSRKWIRSREQWRHGRLNRWDDRMSYLDGEGHLVIRARWDSEQGIVRSGAVETRGKFQAGYGYYEASIAFPTAPGTWGAFWMMCGNVLEGGRGVEIDVVETINNEQDECSCAMHWDGYGEHHKMLNSGGKHGLGIYDGGFHTFALDRTPDGYTYYIDGREIWHVTPDLFPARPTKGYLWLSIEAADWAGAGTPECIRSLPAEMLVDYVRVYKRKPCIQKNR